MVFVAVFVSYRAYKIWKPRHLVELASQFLAKSDVANSALCLRQALEADPINFEACRMMADLTESVGAREALFWRGRLVELQPGSMTNRLALARTAIASGEPLVAQQALDGVAETDKETSLFQSAAGSVDLAAGHLAEAEQHFTRAVDMEPTNAFLQLKLSALQLRKNDEKVQSVSRTVLEGLCTNEMVRCEALRQLTADALRHTNTTVALELSRELLGETNATFSDRLLHLDILRLTKSPERDSCLAALQKEAAGTSAEAYDVAKWMFASEPQIALNWIKTLPPTTRTNLPVPLIETDCYMAAQNWKAVLTNLSRQSWRKLDCLRLASLARAYRELGAYASAKAEWIAATKATGNRLDLLTELLTPARAWNWPQETEAVLWIIVNHYPNERWAAAALAEQFLSTGRTRSLLSLYGTLLQNKPGDLSVMNNLAMAALLTQSWEKKPHELALEVYTKSVTNASFASTYAFSLLLQQKPDQALKVMEQLTPSQLEKPGTAGYYGLILNAAGNSDKARKYLVIAAKARLLPEEQKLVEKALTKKAQT
jgi:tetratricopeptide (TPR) repeat protein